MGKLTYLGYAGVLLTTAGGILILLPAPYLFLIGKWHFVELAFHLWTIIGMGWRVVSIFIQGLDSLLNRFF